MYDFIKNLAELKGWHFGYGLQAYHNVFEPKDDETVEMLSNKTFAFLDTLTSTPQLNEHGGIESTRYNSSLTLLRSSIIDEPDYQVRYDKYIKPLIEEFKKDFLSSLSCTNNIKVESIQFVEVINMFDYNFDGILITFQVLVDG